MHYLEHNLSDKNLSKFYRELQKEDLKDIESLGENKTIDQIKTLRAINKSHDNFLHELKTKASKSSIRQTSNENFDDNNTQQFDDTMDLFN
jgi:hypothetical protein